MCSVCGCDLPKMANGTITRATWAIHRRGDKHQARLAAKIEEERSEAEHERTRFEAERERESQQLKSDRYHLLLLSIVATQLRMQHESVEGARLAWLLESRCLLRRLDNPPIESAILESTTKAIGAANMRKVAQDSHVLV